LNAHRVSDVRQIEIHTDGPSVPEPSSSEFEIATVQFKRYKSPGRCQIRAELFKQEVTYHGLRSVNSLILFGIRKNYLLRGKSPLLYQLTRRVVKLAVIIIEGYHCFQLHTTFYPIFFPQG
jgi:hypothetical protein